MDGNNLKTNTHRVVMDETNKLHNFVRVPVKSDINKSIRDISFVSREDEWDDLFFD